MNDRSPERPGYDAEEQPEKVGGAIGGATFGAVGGGLAIGTLGPLGTILGVLASTAGGWWAGREFIRAVRDLDDVDEDLRRRHREEEVFGEWEDTRHAYQLGFLAGRNPGYEGEEFQVFEEELRTAWMSAQADIDPPLAWDLVQKQARLGWDLAHEDR